ncbi:MAG: hypothetical protein WCV58_02095 [Patescibacteria group bacterium]
MKKLVFNKAARIAFGNRKAERYSKVGRDMEARVYQVLNQALKNGQPCFSKVIYHEPNGIMDRDGADFTVIKIADEAIHSISFGISISRKHCEESKLKHSDRLQMHFPINIKDSTIVEKVEKLFFDQRFSRYLEKETIKASE